MKILFALIFTALSVNTFCQPIIQNGNNLPGYGYISQVSIISGTNPGSSGTNQTWDFSTASSTLIGIKTIVNPSISTFSASFPTSNFASNLSGTYSYLFWSTTKMEIQANCITTPGSGEDFSANSKTILKFPFNYNDSLSDTYQQFPWLTYTVNLKYDGFGTLITPTNTYSNVVRIKEYYTHLNDTYYNWYTLNPLKVVATSSSGAIYFHEDNVTGIQNVTTSAPTINLYPNPSSGVVTILGIPDSKDFLLEIFDLFGKKVLKKFISKTESQIDLSIIPKGIYFYQLFNERSVLNAGKIVLE